MQLHFKPLPLANYAHWVFFKEAFTPEECDTIKSLFVNFERASIENNTLAESVRKSEVSWIHYRNETKWIYDRLSKFIFDTNLSRYGFDLSGFGDPLQIGKYSEGSFYDWHMDLGAGEISTRKLSIVLQLSNPEDYEGGELEFLGHNEKAVKGQGDLILFPSFNLHRVTEVTRGERFSLVAWISGPSFR